MTAVAEVARAITELPQEAIYDVGSLGEGYALRSRRTVEFTPEFASNFLEYAEFSVGDTKVDRNLQEPHVVHLAREMLKGTFLWEQVNLVTCSLEGREYRLNGQHCAWARLCADQDGMDKKTRTPVQHLRYDAKTIQDMRRLYASIDRGKSRNHGNVVVSYLAGSEEFPDYSKGVLRLLAQGLATWLWESDHRRTLHGSDDRCFLLSTDHHKTALHVGAFLKNSRPQDLKHMRRAPVVAAMFATCAKAPMIAQDFWMVVRDGVGLASKEDPRLVLRSYLLASNLTSTMHLNGDDKYKIVTQESMYRTCIYLWNCFRANKAVKVLKPALLTERQEAR